MSYSVNISGHIAAAEKLAADVEQRLHDELAAVLSKPEYGCTSSNFYGSHVRSNSLHVAQDSPEVEHVHETTAGDGAAPASTP